MNIRLKCRNAEPSGWLRHVLLRGCKASSGIAPFGKVIWLIKKDGEAIKITQGMDSAPITTIESPTEKQREIASILEAAGIAAIF